MIPGLDLAAAPFELTGSAKSVIYLWLGGGVTHIDSFDPKPEAPEEIRGELTAISTRLPGVQFCETMPRMASIADDLAVLRSYSHDSNSHLPSQVYNTLGAQARPQRTVRRAKSPVRSCRICSGREMDYRGTLPCPASRGRRI